MAEYWSAFLVGLLSSFHCVGMCGPIALALPTGNSNLIIFKNTLLYNIGRVITYSFLGLLVGLFGRLFFYSGLSQMLSIVMGVLIILGFTVSQKRLNTITKWFGIEYFTNFLRTLFSKLFSQEKSVNLLLIGIVNGFLPCGFVYLATGNALVLIGGVEKSIFYMLFFGLGTIPLMFILIISKSLINNSLRSIFTKVVPYIAVLMGILLIIRGLELNIPYLSPLIDFSTNGEVDVECH